eukprot:m.80734 g.80734  ORF g.80734 m.80734 type:complete len:341 (+) comp12777_c0_seq1:67-1089(+)
MLRAKTLLTGAEIPTIGLGLWKSTADSGVKQAVKDALDAGYRLLDGAAAYGNEKEVGDALKEVFDEGSIKRDDVFVVSKLFQTHHVWKGDTSRVTAALNKTLSDLQLEYLDLYLMHWPFAFEQIDVSSIGGFRLADGTPNPKLNFEMEYKETWKEMTELLKSGKVKAIGVSNFTVEQLKDLIENVPGVKPAVNQCEMHPYLSQPELRTFCEEQKIVMMAYSPLGSGDSYSGKSFPEVGTGPFQTPSGGTTLLQNSVVKGVAEKLGKSPAQVLIRWSLQKGLVCIPKSTKKERIGQNGAVHDFEISKEDMDALEALNCGFRYGIGYSKGHYDCPNAPWFNK